MRKPKRDYTKAYMCIGEEYRIDIPVGDCGDIRSLQGWIEYLFPVEDKDELFPEWMPQKKIIEEIYQKTGKALKAV